MKTPPNFIHRVILKPEEELVDFSETQTISDKSPPSVSLTKQAPRELTLHTITFITVRSQTPLSLFWNPNQLWKLHRSRFSNLK